MRDNGGKISFSKQLIIAINDYNNYDFEEEIGECRSNVTKQVLMLEMVS